MISLREWRWQMMGCDWEPGCVALGDGPISAARPRSLGTQPEDLRLALREPDVS